MPYYDFYTWDKRVTSIGQHWMWQVADFTLNRVARLIDPVRQVAEIGPGWGTLWQVCSARRLAYTAIDANFAIVRQMADGDRVCAFAPPLPVRDAVFDAVIANHVLEHAASMPQAQALLAEMKRVARPGGCVVITSPDMLWQGPYFWDCDYSHNFATSARRLQQMFVDADLQVAWLEYAHNHLTGWQGRLAGWITRLVPYRVLDAMPTSRLYWDRLYRLRLTFGRSVLIIGRKPEGA